MELQEIFIPINVKDELDIDLFSDDCWFNSVEIHERDFPSLVGKKIALFTIVSNKNDKSNNIIRNYLYAMTKKEFGKIVADLGTFVYDPIEESIHSKLAYVLSELQSEGIIPLMIGSSQESTYSQYLAYEFLKKYCSLVTIDSRIDFMMDENEEVQDKNYLFQILSKDPTYLFNLSFLAFQTFMTDSKTIELMESQHFETVRIGKIRDNFEDVEPVIRNADFISFDISAIRQADAPGSQISSPAGLQVEEACKLLRFAGLSDSLSSMGIYGYNYKKDFNNQTAHLIAQMIWYFVDGVIHRYNEVLIGDPINYVKYIATNNSSSQQLTFYKSKKTGRWWMEIPSFDKDMQGKEVIACSYKDYEMATKGEVPERWWRSLKRWS